MQNSVDLFTNKKCIILFTINQQYKIINVWYYTINVLLLRVFLSHIRNNIQRDLIYVEKICNVLKSSLTMWISQR